MACATATVEFVKMDTTTTPTYVVPISLSNLHDMEYNAIIRQLKSAGSPRRSQSAKNYQTYQAELEGRTLSRKATLVGFTRS